jgi:predicted DNA-binding transcriptional regulator AlpA
MPLMFSVSEFCRAHGISRGTFYKLLGEGHGPTTVKIGRRTLITNEAASEWRRRLEAQAANSGQRAA